MDVLIIAGNARSLIANRSDLIVELLSRGMTVAAAVPTKDYIPQVENLGIDIYPIAMSRTSVNPLNDFSTAYSLFRLMHRLKPKVVFGYTVKPVIYGSMAARLSRVPHVYSMITGLGHIYTEHHERSVRSRLVRGIVTTLYRTAIKCNNTVFFQNPDDESDFKSMGILRDDCKSVMINGSGVDVDRYAQMPLPEGNIVFMLISRLLVDKGVTEFVEAATRVHLRYPEARFIVVGPFDPSLPRAISKASLDDWKTQGVVEFLGGVSDVRPLLARCSVFVLPSYYREGTPRSILEAMSVGRAVITSDSAGCRETVIDGVNGFLVEPRASLPLAEAMERFLIQTDLIKSMGQSSRQLAVEKYDVRQVNRVILQAMGLV